MVRSAAALSLLALGGCAASSFGPSVDGGGAAEDNLSPTERRLQAAESKLTLMQRRLDALNTTRFDDDNARLRDEMRILRGDVEKARFDMQQSERRAKDLYQDLDRRMQTLESRGSAPQQTSPYSGGYSGGFTPSAPSAGVIAPPALPSGPSSSGGVAVISQGAGSPEEEGAYLASFDLLKGGKYDEAIRGFKGVLDKYPQGRYADNAAYWMGEANYVKRDYNAALAAFQTVVNTYTSSPKVPDAALKSGLTLLELKRTDEGRAALQQVIQRYPTSNAAKLATSKLAALDAKKP